MEAGNNILRGGHWNWLIIIPHMIRCGLLMRGSTILLWLFLWVGGDSVINGIKRNIIRSLNWTYHLWRQALLCVGAGKLYPIAGRRVPRTVSWSSSSLVLLRDKREKPSNSDESHILFNHFGFNFMAPRREALSPRADDQRKMRTRRSSHGNRNRIRPAVDAILTIPPDENANAAERCTRNKINTNNSLWIPFPKY